jgi:hypothetical protein
MTGPTRPAVLLWLALALPAGGQTLRFAEVAADWGLEFEHHTGATGERYMPETVVGGLALFDYDFDGDVDVLFVDGGTLVGSPPPDAGSRLFRNDGPGSFVDVTGRAALQWPGYGSGVTAGDVDNDGDLDLYLTAVGRNLLLLNQGDGSFREVTEAAGAEDARWSASAAFADVDRDGDLDLYVTNYVDFRVENHKFCGNQETGLRGYCAPRMYNGELDRFFRNRGDGTFEDATAAAGLSGAVEAGLGVVFGDLDDDGWPDLYVANDADPNFFFHNRGDGTFEDHSLLSGTAFDENGRAEGGMGVDLGDVDGDGRLDIFVTNFEFESNALYRNVGSGLFSDQRFAFRLAESSLEHLAFGIDLADFDLDGDLDAIVANGHILDNASQFNELSSFEQPNQLFENLGGVDGPVRFREETHSGLDSVRVSRGLASGDLDGDGDLEVAILNSGAAGELWENRSEVGAAGWLLVDLVGAASNRYGVGARVTLESGGQNQMREVRTASSYLSQSPITLHFGLGETVPESLSVSWPSGKRQVYPVAGVDRRLRLFEDGQSSARR